MKLEDLREDDIGTVLAWFPKFGDNASSKTPLTYPHFSGLAFYDTADQIRQLEFSNWRISQGNATQTSVGMWFISIEAYINTLLRITCLAMGKSFDSFKTKDFGARIKTLLDILEVDRTPFYKGPFQRLEEFKRYRNELFHDRTDDQPLEFQKTSFSKNPMYANQVDAMQASIIALEVYEAFRYVLPNIDLMPQIMITKASSFFFFPIDRLYNEMLRPYFEATLSKHSLTSSIDLNIEKANLEISPIFQNTEIRIIIKAISDSRFDPPVSKQQTNFGLNLFEKIRNEVQFDTETHMKMANYHRY
jgi:hypothetical protein